MVKVSGARLMTRTLREAGIEFVAGIPGHTVLTLANTIGDEPGLAPLLVRHEAVAAFAADVYYRISGRLMALFTHAFPGAANALAGVSNAYADSSAMLLIAGETASAAVGRGAYQELSRQFDGDTAQLIRHVVKRVWQPRQASDLVEKTFAAVRTAVADRPGPVALSVSHEIWDEEIEIPDWPTARGYLFATRTRAPADAVERVHRALLSARRPLILAGNGVNLGRARSELRSFADRYGVPVATTVTGKGAFPEDHDLSLGIIGWVGTAPANWAAQNADLVLCLGARLTETTSSSWLPGVTFDFQRSRLIQVDIDQASIANAYPVDEAIVGDVRLVLQDLLAASDARAKRSTEASWTTELAKRKREWRDVVRTSQSAGHRGLIGVGAVVESLRRHYDGIPINLVSDCGKHHKWVAQQFEAHTDDHIVGSMGGATMGLGPAGAIGAALARPSAPTIAWTGDGGMSMWLNVWPTVAERQLPIKFVVIDDGAYGAVANMQSASIGRTAYTEFNADGANPTYGLDLAAVAAACGLAARKVEDPEAIDDAIEWAKTLDGPAVIDFKVDRMSMAPSGGGRYLPDIWHHRTLPWARAAKDVAGTRA